MIHISLAACRRSSLGSIAAATAHWLGLCMRVGVAARFRAFAGKLTGFFGSVVSTPGIATYIATERELVTSKRSGNLRDVVLDFYKAVNLISFNLAEVFVINWVSSTCRS